MDMRRRAYRHQRRRWCGAAPASYHARMPARWEALAALPPVAPVVGMKAAVLVPIYEAGDRLHLIMTRRPEDMRSHPGDVVFPGGMIDPADDGPVQTAVREAEEEVGLARSDIVEILGALAPVHTRSVTMRRRASSSRMDASIVRRFCRPRT